MTIKLTCPFCRSQTLDVKRERHRGEAFWVQCVLCGARGPRVYTKPEAVMGWNIRPLAYRIVPQARASVEQQSEHVRALEVAGG